MRTADGPTVTVLLPNLAGGGAERVMLTVAGGLARSGARVRLLHPAFWAGNFLGVLLSLWLSACFLALFRRVEPVTVVEPEPGPE